ncbi:hypothetical protein PILCRDRAFT_11274 [Piloderma croceum F 1598]|uniref:Uncharacterized protein n=1 Tax=Piloderma croceum (strain F 1598) TaxID=765440 RepID=A0A0C3FEH4_PILCF|nr:hypothetical protein PILCRDRAFT_11274 [Piloderma croceum F 1598]
MEMPVLQDSDEHQSIGEMSNHHAVDETIITMLRQLAGDNLFGTMDGFDLSDNGQAAIAVEGSSMSPDNFDFATVYNDNIDPLPNAYLSLPASAFNMSPFNNTFTTVDPATFASPAIFIDTDNFLTGAKDDSFVGFTADAMTVGSATESVADFHTQMSNISSQLIKFSAPVLSNKGQLIYGVQPMIVQNSLTKADLAKLVKHTALALVGTKEHSTKVLTQNGFYRSRKFAPLPDPLTGGIPSRLSFGLHNPNWHRTSSHASNSDFISAVVTAVSCIPIVVTAKTPHTVVIAATEQYFNTMRLNYRIQIDEEKHRQQKAQQQPALLSID